METAPLEWACAGFPLPHPEAEEVTLDFVIEALWSHLEQVTEEDTTALSAVLHIAHLLKTWQGTDGLWPARLNVRFGRAVGEERSCAPVPLFRHLNERLHSTEFTLALELAEPTCDAPVGAKGGHHHARQ